MPITARRKTVEYVNPDPGLYVGVCVDIEEGVMKAYKPEDPDKDALTFYWLLNKDNPKTGRPFEVQRRFSFSMFAGKNGSGGSSLYQTVKSWLGTALSQEEADSLDLEMFLGESCQILIVHNETKDGRTFANVSNVLPLAPRQAKLSIPEGYRRRKDRAEA